MALHVVLMQVVRQAPEDVDLQAGYVDAPGDRCDPHQVRLTAAGSTAIQQLGRFS